MPSRAAGGPVGFATHSRYGPLEPPDPNPYCRCGLMGVTDLEALVDLLNAGLGQPHASLLLWSGDVPEATARRWRG